MNLHVDWPVRFFSQADGQCIVSSQLPIRVCAIVGLEVAATSFIEILRSQVPHVAHVAWMNQLSTHIGSRGSWACGRHEVVLWTTCLLSRSAHRQRGRGAVINGPKPATEIFCCYFPLEDDTMDIWANLGWYELEIPSTLKTLHCTLKPPFQLVLSKEWSNDSKFTVKSRFFPL